MADVVFFDAAGTLFRVKGSVGEIYSRVAAKYGLMADSEAVEAELRAAFHAKTSEGLLPGETGLRAEKAWWLDVVLRTFAGKMPPEAMNAYFDEVFETFRGAGAWELFEETRACLQHLRSWGYRLAVISNFDSRLFDVLANLSNDSFFEQVILSWHAGSAKPDQAIFRRALEAVHAVAADALQRRAFSDCPCSNLRCPCPME